MPLLSVSMGPCTWVTRRNAVKVCDQFAMLEEGNDGKVRWNYPPGETRTRTTIRLSQLFLDSRFAVLVKWKLLLRQHTRRAITDPLVRGVSYTKYFLVNHNNRSSPTPTIDSPPPYRRKFQIPDAFTRSAVHLPRPKFAIYYIRSSIPRHSKSAMTCPRCILCNYQQQRYIQLCASLIPSIANLVNVIPGCWKVENSSHDTIKSVNEPHSSPNRTMEMLIRSSHLSATGDRNQGNDR